MSIAKDRGVFCVESCAAWTATFLLTLLLSICNLSLLAVQALTSTGLHTAILTNEQILDRQTESIYEYIDLLANEYGFSGEEIRNCISREDLRTFNLEIAEWWKNVLTEGKTYTIPRWYSPDMENAVFTAMSGKNLKEDPRTIAADLTEKIDRTVFPLREVLLITGFDMINDRADLPEILRSLQRIPFMTLVFALLAAGIIALALARDSLRSLKHYGTALAGAGLVIGASGMMKLLLQPGNTLAQASAVLAEDFGALMRTLLLEAGAAALLLLCAGYICLYIYRRRKQKMYMEVMEHTE